MAFKKVACGRFNYGNKFNRKIASEMSILLPTTKSDAKIQATKEIISQEAPVQKDSLF
ncbi:hypothetical protein ACOWL0_00540 [Helicobacter pylori]